MRGESRAAGNQLDSMAEKADVPFGVSHLGSQESLVVNTRGGWVERVACAGYE